MLNSLSLSSSTGDMMPSAMEWVARPASSLPGGLVGGGAVAVGAAGYPSQGEPEVLLVEGVISGGLSGEVDHFLEPGVTGPAAVGVVSGDQSCFIAAVLAGAGGGFQEVGDWHGGDSCGLRFLGEYQVSLEHILVGYPRH